MAKISRKCLDSGENIKGQTIVALKSHQEIALLRASTDTLSSL